MDGSRLRDWNNHGSGLASGKYYLALTVSCNRDIWSFSLVWTPCCEVLQRRQGVCVLHSGAPGPTKTTINLLVKRSKAYKPDDLPVVQYRSQSLAHTRHKCSALCLKRSPACQPSRLNGTCHFQQDTPSRSHSPNAYRVAKSNSPRSTTAYYCSAVAVLR